MHFYSISMQSVELTEKALDFLKRMFDAFDSDGVSIDKIIEYALRYYPLLDYLKSDHCHKHDCDVHKEFVVFVH